MMGTTIDLLIEDDQADLKLEIACQLLDIYNKRFSANDSEWFCCKAFQKIYFSVKLRKKTERTE